jgi:hypothetical protein
MSVYENYFDLTVYKFFKLSKIEQSVRINRLAKSGPGSELKFRHLIDYYLRLLSHLLRFNQTLSPSKHLELAQTILLGRGRRV